MTAFVYDAVGNKSSQTTYKTCVTGQTVNNKPTPTQDAANDRTIAYTYDKMGRQLSTEIQNIAYGRIGLSNQYEVSTGLITNPSSHAENSPVRRTSKGLSFIFNALYEPGAGESTIST